MKYKLPYRICAFTIILALLVLILSGCGESTGAKTPEKLIKRFVNAITKPDPDEVLDCLLPSLSKTYRMAASMLSSLTGQDFNAALDESLTDIWPTAYGYSQKDMPDLKNYIYMLSKQQSDYSATVLCLVIFQVGDKYDYFEAYFITSKINSSWYLSSIMENMPIGYTPTHTGIDDNQRKSLIDTVNMNRITTIDDPSLSNIFIRGTDVGYIEGMKYADKSVALPWNITRYWDQLSLPEQRLWFDLSVKRADIERELESREIDAYLETINDVENEDSLMLGITYTMLIATNFVGTVTGDLIEVVQDNVNALGRFSSAVYSDITSGTDRLSEEMQATIDQFILSLSSEDGLNKLSISHLISNSALSDKVIKYLLEDIERRQEHEMEEDFTYACIDAINKFYNRAEVKSTIKTLIKLLKAARNDANSRSLCLGEIEKLGNITFEVTSYGENTIRKVVLTYADIIDLNCFSANDFDSTKFVSFLEAVDRGDTYNQLLKLDPDSYFLNPELRNKVFKEMYPKSAFVNAIRSPWNAEGMKKRHVVVLWSDAPTHELGFGSKAANYPANMAKSFEELSLWWGDMQTGGYMDQRAKRLLIFTPDVPEWSRIAAEWNNVIMVTTTGEGLKDIVYEEVLAGICNTI